MQALWYAQETADAHFRQGNYGRALKKYLEIDHVCERELSLTLLLMEL
jgi:hypothetical protein